MDSEYDDLAEHLMTALVLTLAHDLAFESRRKGVSGRDYIGDAVELILQTRPRILELLRCRRAASRSVAGVASDKPGRTGLPEGRLPEGRLPEGH
ncbi:MAG TPA: hypothetical protein VMV15_06510 [Candidatus Binataceae bacterium]|nr:hypothetical protein [Candidatus Binataceae bacterium]